MFVSISTVGLLFIPKLLLLPFTDATTGLTTKVETTLPGVFRADGNVQWAIPARGVQGCAARSSDAPSSPHLEGPAGILHAGVLHGSSSDNNTTAATSRPDYQSRSKTGKLLEATNTNRNNAERNKLTTHKYYSGRSVAALSNENGADPIKHQLTHMRSNSLIEVDHHHHHLPSPGSTAELQVARSVEA